MLPEIVIGERIFPMYGVCAAIGAVLAALYLRRYEKTLTPDAAGDIDLALIWGLIGGMIGAKLLYLIVNLQRITADFPAVAYNIKLFMQKYFYGGFVFYGGLYGFLVSVAIYAKCEKRPYEILEKPLLPTFILFHAFGRIGCFFTGCCYGIPTNSVLGVSFTRSQIAPNGVLLLPVQLFEAAGEIILFFVLPYFTQKTKRSLTGIYLTTYGTMRFILEFFRGDAYRGRILMLSVSQVISLVSIMAGICLILKRSRKKADRC